MSERSGPSARLQIRVLGPIGVVRDGVPVALPRSRKVRALLAFLALEQRPSSRSRLCDLLWDVPNDPRGELRWSLSKLRGVLDDATRTRVVTTGQALIALDLRDDFVDVRELDQLVAGGVGAAASERLAEAADLFAGDLLEGMQIDGPEFAGWLLSQRQRYRALQVEILSELARRAPPASEQRFRRLEAWLKLAPFDSRAHEAMIDALVRAGRPRDAEAHVQATARAFEQEGLGAAPLRAAWHDARGPGAEPPSSVSSGQAPEPAPASDAAPPSRRGSVVVMPFVEGSPGSSQVANGLTDDIITRLAKLRVLFVIARGSAYALGERGVGAHEAGRILNVEYVVSGVVRRQGDKLSVLVELARTSDAGIVWADEFEGAADQTFSVLDSIVNRIVALISEEIERAESMRALIKPPSSLDAWEAYHRGLWHMYRFNAADNKLAERFFGAALALDANFARAHAGLSFTHFQNVFLGLTPDRERQVALALDTAHQSLAADDRDPAAHWALGRALWLLGEQGESVVELARSVELSPNFALGHYTLGFVHAQSGDPQIAIDATDHSRRLSPFDPLQFGMLAARALAHMRLGQREQAAHWAVRAAGRPNAHAHILAIAAVNQALHGQRDQAREQVARIRAKLPSYGVEDFLRAFRLTADAEQLVRSAATEIDFA
jgi:DNA-binding SARP family transcriptional activator/TolB-like protein